MDTIIKQLKNYENQQRSHTKASRSTFTNAMRRQTFALGERKGISEIQNLAKLCKLYEVKPEQLYPELG